MSQYPKLTAEAQRREQSNDPPKETEKSGSGGDATNDKKSNKSKK